MNRGVDHGPIFFGDEDRVELGRRLGAIHEEHGVTTLAYCLMGNHYHLLLRAPAGELSAAMHHMSSVYTRHTNDRVGRDGPLFRGRFHSIPVETDAYLLRACRYIHRNPLDLPGVTSPRAYRWSSYRAYLGLRRAPPFLDLAPVTDLLGGRPEQVAASTEDDAVISPRPTIDRAMTAADLRMIVACGIAVDDLVHGPEEVARQRLDRTVLTLLADRCHDPALRRLVVEARGERSDEATAAATRRARRRFEEDPMLRRIVAWVESELGPGPPTVCAWHKASA